MTVIETVFDEMAVAQGAGKVKIGTFCFDFAQFEFVAFLCAVRRAFRRFVVVGMDLEEVGIDFV